MLCSASLLKFNFQQIKKTFLIEYVRNISGTNFGSNYHPGDGFMPSAAEEYDVNLDSGNSIITRHLRAELENRLVMAINCNDDANDTVDNGSDSIRNMCEQDTVSPKLKFPDNLVSVIAGHVIQESSLEPCGLKGKLRISVGYVRI